MTKSISGYLILLLSCLLFSSTAIARISHSKIEEQVALVFYPYYQMNVPINMEPEVQSRLMKDIYSVQFSPASRTKNVALDHTSFRVKVYYNGNPRGITTITTDHNHHFIFDQNFIFADKDRKIPVDKSSLVFELMPIETKNPPLRCTGGSSPRDSNILINCKSY